MAGAVVLAACLTGCSDGGDEPTSVASGPPSSDAGTNGSSFTPPPFTGPVNPVIDIEKTYAPTFSALWDELVAPTCALVFCHGDALHFSLRTKEIAYETLLGDVAKSGPCIDTGLRLVAPGEPDSSLFYLKVTDSPPCGERMPLVYGLRSGAIEDAQLEQLREWIALGAPND